MAKKNLEALVTVVSKRNPSEKWTVWRHALTGALSCNCPAWVFRPCCSACGATLLKKQLGADGDGKAIYEKDAEGHTIMRCPDHGMVGAGNVHGAVRACKHVRAFLEEEAHPETRHRPHTVGEGQGVTLHAPEVADTLAALLKAADSVGVRDRIFERQWEQIARRITGRVRKHHHRGAEALVATSEVAMAGVRTIYLED